MRQTRLLVLVGVAVFAVVVLATLPASLIAGRLPTDLTVLGVSGTVWNGAADEVRLRGAPLGSLTWNAEWGALATGSLAFHVEVTRPDGFLRGRVAATLTGALEGNGLDLDLPITALHPEHGNDAWAGSLSGRIEHVRLEHGWPVELTGSFAIAKLRPPGSPLEIGGYRIEFDGRANTAEKLVGRVRDVEAPLLVRGQLEIRHDRAYLLQGEVTPRPGASPQVSEAVAFLGLPDAAGRRSFEITGTF